MKRNTALTRKLKQLSEETKQSILDDILKTNQSKVQSWQAGLVYICPNLELRGSS